LKAVVLAGGEGTRLRPLTFTRPKPMLPLGPNPIIHYVLSHLFSNGFQDIIIIVGYLKDQLMGYLGDGSQFGVRITYVVEPEGVAFGTAGSLKLAAHLLDETFLVVQSDTISEISLAEMARFHSDRGGEVSIALTEVADPSLYGVAVLGGREEIVKFLEKPPPGTALSKLASTGFYILEPEVVDYIEDEKWDFARDLFPYLMRVGEQIFGFSSKSFWVDVGELNGYLKGADWVLRKLDQDAPPSARVLGSSKRRVFVNGNVGVGQRVQISGPSWFDTNTKIGDDVKIGPGTVLEEDSHILSGTIMDQTVTFRHTEIGSNCSVRSTIIGERAVVGSNVTIDRAIIGQGCTIGDRARILPGSRLWPNTRVEAGATVDGIMAVPRDKSFYFDTGLGQYSGILASSIGEFLEALKIVPLESLEYHIGRRDFEKWAKDVLGSIQLADNIRTLRRSQLKGEELRLQMVRYVMQWAERVSSPNEIPDQGKRLDSPLTTV
jgi:NDP-sugar pyrophosphorylase family protein